MESCDCCGNIFDSENPDCVLMPGSIVVAHDELFLVPSDDLADVLYERYQGLMDPEEVLVIELTRGEPSMLLPADMRFATGADIVNLL